MVVLDIHHAATLHHLPIPSTILNDSYDEFHKGFSPMTLCTRLLERPSTDLTIMHGAYEGIAQ